MINKSCSKQQKIWMEKAFIGLMGIVFLFVISCGGAGDATTATSPGSPTPPSEVNFTKTSFTGNEVTLSWTAPSPGTTDGTTPAKISKYIVKYRVVGDNNFIEIDGSSQGIRLKEGLTGTSTSVTVIGLTPGTDYTFLIAAVNSGGATTPDTDAAKRIVKTREASAPSAVKLAVNDSASTSDQVVLRWTAPDDPGIDAEGNIATISGYIVKYRTADNDFTPIEFGEGEGVRLAEALTDSSTNATVIGLTQNTTYTFLVAAVNSFETTPDEEAAKLGHATPAVGATSPSAVDNLTVDSITSSNMVLSWTAPTDPGTINGSIPADISKYIVEYKTENSGLFVEISENENGEGVRLSAPLTGTTTTATVIGLKPSTEYTFRVAAVNSGNKRGPADAEVTRTTTIEEVEEATSSSAVENLTVDFITNDYVVLSWSEPTNMGTIDGNTLAELSRYVVEYKESASNDFDFVPINKTGNGVRLSEEWADTSTTATVTNLKPNTEYIFQVAAINSGNKRGEDRDVMGTTTRKTATPPSAVGDFKVVSFSYSFMELSWIEPTKGTTDGVTPATLTGYIIEYTKTADNNFVVIDQNDQSSQGVRLTAPLTGTSTSVIVTNLTGSTDYTFSIAAVNSGDEVGEYREARGTTKATPTSPSRVLDLGSSSTHDQVTLSWTAPDNPGIDSTGEAADLTRYVVKYRETVNNNFIEIDENSDGVKLSTELTGTSTNVTVINLDPDTEYTFSVAAVNSGSLVGPEATKDQRTAVLPAILTPTGLSAQAVSTCNKIFGVKLTWDATSGAASYNLYRDGAVIESITTNSYTDKPAPGSHIYTVQACKGSGECSGESTSTQAVTIDGSFASIVYRGEVPADLSQYDNKSQELFSRYQAGATLVARYVSRGGTGNGTTYTASGNLKTVMDGITDAGVNNVYVVFVGGNTSSYNPGSSMVMKNHVAIVGTVNINDDCLNPSTAPTVISGGSHRVFENIDNQLNHTALLYRVTIQGANTTGNGGGMYNKSSSPALIGITFSNNKAAYGGGMYNQDSSPTLTKVNFEGNEATPRGGGMYNNNSSPLIVGATFSGNKAIGTGGRGGAIYNQNSSPTFIGVTIHKNSAGQYGSAIINDNNGKRGPTIINGIIWQNLEASGVVIGIDNDGTAREDMDFYNNLMSWGMGSPFSGQGLVIESGRDYTTGSYGSFSLFGGSAPVRINHKAITDRNFAALGPLADNDGLVRTHAITPNHSTLVNQGLYVRKAGTTFYYSANNADWYTNPNLDSSVKVDELPEGTEDLTATDARGYTRDGRPDIGAHESGGQPPTP